MECADPEPQEAEREIVSRETFAQLYGRHYGKVFTYIMRTVMNRNVAEDITAETFLRALTKLPSYQAERGSFSTWIFRIATHVMRDHFRRDRRLVHMEPDNVDLESLLSRQSEPNDPAKRLERLETYERLHQSIRGLKPAYRIAIVLYYFEEKNLEEIARIVGTPQATVRWRLHRARKLLGCLLEEEGRSEI